MADVEAKKSSRHRSSSSSKSSLKKAEIKEFADMTHFGPMEVIALHHHFESISSTNVNDGVIDRKEFQKALGFKDSLYMDRMFELFDENGDGFINFCEFVTGLSLLSNKSSTEEKLRFSFQIYDFDNDEKICKDELFRMLQASLIENDIHLSKKQMMGIVDTTFEEADINKDGFIDFDEYKQLVFKHPMMLKQMNVNISAIIEDRQKAAARKTKK